MDGTNAIDLVQATGAADVSETSAFYPTSHKGDVTSVRMKPSYGKGGYDLISVSPGIGLAISNFISFNDHIEINPGKDIVKIHFQINGRGNFNLTHNKSFSVEDMTAGILFHPQGLKKSEHYAKTDQQLAVTLLCDAIFLRETLSESMKNLPEVVIKSLCGNVMDFLYLSFPVSHEMTLATQSLLHYRYQPGIGKLQLQSKSYELLYEFFRRLEDLERTAQGHNRITGADYEKAEQARQCLEQNYVNPPSLITLAHNLGTNEVKLANIFKAQFGVTVSDYVQKIRMENAQALLRQTDLSVTQIALDIGYGHSSNFATAFKRFTGVSPREYRTR